MNGAEFLISALEFSGVDTCFANPGTSEMHFVAALDGSTSMRGILGLFEGVVTGAADGYGRMLDRPAATLLHLGPGLANANSSLHNAKRALSPVVNVVGDHARNHLELDAPLTSDVEGAARPFSNWVRTSSRSEALLSDAAEAVTVALRGNVSTLVLPADVSWTELEEVPSNWPCVGTVPRPRVDQGSVEAAARALIEAGPRGLILMGGRTMRAEAVEFADRIGAATGARVCSDTFLPRVERGAGRHNVGTVPYPLALSQELFSRYDTVVLVGTKPPVAFFAYPNSRSEISSPGTRFVDLCPSSPFAHDSLSAVYDALPEKLRHQDHESRRVAMVAEHAVPDRPSGSITREKLAAFLGSAIPENSIIVDESITTGSGFYSATTGALPHDWLSATGGAIGWALPVATGAAIACPERKVVCLESDGSGAYMPQALWTQAREGSDVVTLIFANQRYQILRDEMANVGVSKIGARAANLLDIGSPSIDWVAVARGFGVAARRVETMDDLGKAFDQAISTSGPALIEVLV